MTKRAAGACFIVVLLAVPPLLDAFRIDVGAVRLAGPSLLWWYLGLAAPVLAALVAVATLPDGRSDSRGLPEHRAEAAPAPGRSRRRGGAASRSRR